MTKIRPRLWNRSDPERPRSGISIMRPNRLGNPFVIGVDGDRPTVIEKFRAYARKNPNILRHIAALDDENLICCCAPAPCHGDVLLELWDELNAWKLVDRPCGYPGPVVHPSEA